jgi:hypothetical protein
MGLYQSQERLFLEWITSLLFNSDLVSLQQRFIATMSPTLVHEMPTASLIPECSSQDHSSVEKSLPASFDPSKYLAYSPPASILTMQDLALEPTELSPIATTEPFPLLSVEGVLEHRREIFSDEVLDNCLHHTRPGSVQIRGMAPRYAQFIHQLWHSPEMLGIVSEIAGVELVPAMDYEICHTNVQLGPDGIDAVKKTSIEPPIATAEAIQSFKDAKNTKRDVTDQTKPVIEWHRDSHPWVCVVMLSDATHMVGGETELMKGDGTTLKVKAPQMVNFGLDQGLNTC